MQEIRFWFFARNDSIEVMKLTQVLWSNNLELSTWRNKIYRFSRKNLKILEGGDVMIDYAAFVKITSPMLDF